MDIFNKEKIADLEAELEIYKARCKALERDAKRVVNPKITHGNNDELITRVIRWPTV